MTAANVIAVRLAFEAVGVEFIDENSGGLACGCESPTTPNRKRINRCGLSQTTVDKAFSEGQYARP
jgi:hypothetical protein